MIENISFHADESRMKCAMGNVTANRDVEGDNQLI